MTRGIPEKMSASTANVVCLLTTVMWLVSLRTVQTTQESKGHQNVLVKASFVATVREGERVCVCVCVCQVLAATAAFTVTQIKQEGCGHQSR